MWLMDVNDLLAMCTCARVPVGALSLTEGIGGEMEFALFSDGAEHEGRAVGRDKSLRSTRYGFDVGRLVVTCVSL